MTVRTSTQVDGGRQAPGPSHPLQRLGADEIRRARTVLAEHGLVGEHTRFASLGLEEPPKGEVLAFRPGQPVERRVRAILLDTSTGAATDVVASLTRGAVDSSVVLDTAREGQPLIMLEDLVAVDEIVKGDSGWREAMARRGITELDLVRPCPLSAGSFGIQGEEGRRMLRVLSCLQHHEKDHPWAHPVDGLVAYVDLIERRVVHLIDAELLSVPQEEGNFDDPAGVGPARTTLRPIEITQPEGPSFTVDGDEVTWEGWRLRIGFDAREGLTLHQISLEDRPVVYRASIAEMMVPYADPGQARFWQDYFDAGTCGSPATTRPSGTPPATCQPAPGRRGAAQPCGRRPRHRRGRHRPVAHLRDDALPPARGLAGHARGDLRLRPATGRFLRPQPHPRPAEVTSDPLPPPPNGDLPCPRRLPPPPPSQPPWPCWPWCGPGWPTGPSGLGAGP